jgi:hypothetical protein
VVPFIRPFAVRAVRRSDAGVFLGRVGKVSKEHDVETIAVVAGPGHGVAAGKPVTILDLGRYRDLFRDDAAFDQFVALIVTRMVTNSIAVVANGDVALATLFPATQARDAFQLQIAAKLARSPDLAKELKELAEDRVSSHKEPSRFLMRMPDDLSRSPGRGAWCIPQVARRFGGLSMPSFTWGMHPSISPRI